MISRLFPRMYEGWIVVTSTSMVLLLLSVTVFYGFGVLYNPIRAEFGWSAGAIGLAFSVRSEVNGIAAPVVGAFIDRLGSRRVMVAGLALVVVTVFLLSFMQEIWQFFVLMFVMAIGTSTTGGQASMVSAVSWFERRRAQALGVATAGGAAGGMLTIGVALLEGWLGWRGALRAMAGILLLVGGFAALQVRTRPRGHPQPMDGLARPHTAEGEQANHDDDMRWGVPFRVALRSTAFWMLGIAQAAFFFVWTVVIVYQIPYMEAQGISRPAAAGLGAGALSFAALVSRLVIGRYADRVGRRGVLLVSFVLMTATIPLLLLIENILVGMAILAVIGATASAGSPLRTSLIADYYGIRNFGAINGISMFVGTLGALTGPWIVGELLDSTGEYTAGWLLTTAVAAISIPAIIAARPPHALMERYQAEARAHSRAAHSRSASAEAQPASSGSSGAG